MAARPAPPRAELVSATSRSSSLASYTRESMPLHRVHSHYMKNSYRIENGGAEWRKALVVARLREVQRLVQRHLDRNDFRSDRCELRSNRFGLRGDRCGLRGNRCGLRGNRFGLRGNRFGLRSNKIGLRGNRCGLRGCRSVGDEVALVTSCSSKAGPPAAPARLSLRITQCESR
jgi:hypothetical protein